NFPYTTLFRSNPIGKKIKSGNQWLEVIGILEERVVSDQAIAKLGIRDFNMDVYIPIQTMFVRYKNRDMVTSGSILAARSQNQSGVSQGTTNYHQIDKLVVQVEESNLLNPTAEVISRMLERRHLNVIDYELTIPELLLKQ